MMTFSAVLATVSARSETFFWSFVGLMMNFPSIRPTWVMAQGPSKGMSEIVVASAVPSIAVSSGEQSGSTLITRFSRVTSLR